MNDQDRWWLRLGLLCELVARSPNKLGRTGLMKLAYLLQTVKGLPLGYDFRLYTYGPFDSDVLSDLGAAEALGALKSEMIQFANAEGYGYEFSEGPIVERVQKRAAVELTNYESAIKWALEEFGQLSASDFELLSTIIYADRESADEDLEISFEELCRRVKEIKPRFSDGYVGAKIRELSRKGLLKAACEGIP